MVEIWEECTMVMKGRIGHQDLQDLHQEGEMRERIEEAEITVGLIGMTEEMTNVEIGEKKEIKTPSHVLLVKGHDHRADVLVLRPGGLAQEHGHLRGEGLEPAQDITCLYPRFLLTSPTVT